MAEAEPVVGQDTNTQDAPKNLGGRPLKFESVAALQKLIDDYFISCEPTVKDVTEWVDARDNKGTLKKDQHGLNYLVEVKHKVKTERVPYSITGLALALDTTRRTLLDYEEGLNDFKPGDENYDPLDAGFSHTIKKAKAKIEHDIQLRLDSNMVAGTIFNLKNNFGWIDRTVEDGTQEVVVTTRRHVNNASNSK